MTELENLNNLATILPPILKLFQRAANRINPTAKTPKEVARVVRTSIQVLAKVNPQHEAVGSLIREALGHSAVHELAGDRAADAIENFVRGVASLPSYTEVAKLYSLDSRVLAECVKRWYEILIEFLPQYPEVCRAISLQSAHPGVVLSTLTGKHTSDAESVQFPINAMATDHPEMRDLRRTALRGIQALLEGGRTQEALDQVDALVRDSALTGATSERRYVAGLHLLAAQALFGTRRFTEAGDRVDKAARLLPDDEAITLNKILTLAATANLDDAQACFDSLSVGVKESTHGRFTRSYIEMERGHFREAIVALETLLQEPDLFPEAIANLAICYSRCGLLEKAIDTARSAVDASKGAPKFRVTLGDVCLGGIMLRMHADASATVHRESADSSVGFTSRETTMSIVKDHWEVLQEAIREYETAGRQLPDLLKEEKFLSSLGQAQLFAGNHQRASELLTLATRAEALHPPLIPLIEARIESGDYSGAIEALDEAELVYPESLSHEFARKRIHILLLQEDFGEAETLLTALIDHGKGSLDLYWNRARCYDRLGKPIQAAEDFEKAIELGVEPDRALREMARVYSSHAMKASAASTLRRLLSEKCEDWEVYRDLSSLLIELGNAPEAVSLLLSYPMDPKGNVEKLWFLADAQFASGQYNEALATHEEIALRFGGTLTPQQQAAHAQCLGACREKAG